MKKYCLTDCAKRKLNAGKRNIVSIISALLVIVVIGLALVATVAILGFVSQGGYYLVFGNLIGFFQQNMMEAGLVIMFLVVFGALGLLIIWNVIYGIYTFTKNIVTNKIASDGDYYYDYSECKIFEECKEDE